MPSAASTAPGPSPSATSTSGSIRTAACGPPASTPSNAISTPCPTKRARRNDMDTDPDVGALAKVGDRWELRFSRLLAHPPAKVWRAITEPEHLRAWFPADIEGERAAGAKLRFPFREDEGPTLDGEMLVYDEPRVLALRWGDDVLRFEVEPRDGGAASV